MGENQEMPGGYEPDEGKEVEPRFEGPFFRLTGGHVVSGRQDSFMSIKGLVSENTELGNDFSWAVDQGFVFERNESDKRVVPEGMSDEKAEEWLKQTEFVDIPLGLLENVGDIEDVELKNKIFGLLLSAMADELQNESARLLASLGEIKINLDGSDGDAEWTVDDRDPERLVVSLEILEGRDFSVLEEQLSFLSQSVDLVHGFVEPLPELKNKFSKYEYEFDPDMKEKLGEELAEEGFPPQNYDLDMISDIVTFYKKLSGFSGEIPENIDEIRDALVARRSDIIDLVGEDWSRRLIALARKYVTTGFAEVSLPEIDEGDDDSGWGQF